MTFLDSITPASRLGMFLSDVNKRASDGLSLQDFSAIFFDSLRLAISAVEAIPVEGTERKKMVMDFAGTMFDKYADKIIPIYVYPFWIVVKPAARMLLMSVAAGAVESILPLVREVS
mgnify:CR=1 FL=1